MLIVARDPPRGMAENSVNTHSQSSVKEDMLALLKKYVISSSGNITQMLLVLCANYLNTCTKLEFLALFELYRQQNYHSDSHSQKKCYVFGRNFAMHVTCKHNPRFLLMIIYILTL